MMDKAKIRANNMGDQIKKEISIMKMIRHESVIQLIEVLASASTIFVVMELVTGGERTHTAIKGAWGDRDGVELTAYMHAHACWLRP